MPRTSRSSSLRKKVEELLSKEPEAIGKVSADELKELIYELDDYQIELEMQNE